MVVPGKEGIRLRFWDMSEERQDRSCYVLRTEGCGRVMVDPHVYIHTYIYDMDGWMARWRFILARQKGF